MIHRIRRSCQFTQIANAALRNDRLSYCARGILAMVMSHSDEWKTSKNWLRDQTSREGVTTINHALAELRQYGYLKTTPAKGVDGRLAGWDWEWTDSPDDPPKDAKPLVNQPSISNPTDGSQLTQNTMGTEHHGEEHVGMQAPACEPTEASPYDLDIPYPDDDDIVPVVESTDSKQAVETPPPKPARAPRPKNVLAEALLEACRMDPAKVTKSQWGNATAALKEIKDAYPQVTPADIHALANALRKGWGSEISLFTPMALAKHWRSPSQSLPTGDDPFPGAGKVTLEDLYRVYGDDDEAMMKARARLSREGRY